MVDQADMSDEKTIEILTELFDDVQQLQKEEIAKQQKQDEETIKILTELFDNVQQLQKEEIAKQQKQDEETIQTLDELLPSVSAIREKYAKQEEKEVPTFNIFYIFCDFDVLRGESDEVDLHSYFLWYLLNPQAGRTVSSAFSANRKIG